MAVEVLDCLKEFLQQGIVIIDLRLIKQALIVHQVKQISLINRLILLLLQRLKNLKVLRLLPYSKLLHLLEAKVESILHLYIKLIQIIK